MSRAHYAASLPSVIFLQNKFVHSLHLSYIVVFSLLKTTPSRLYKPNYTFIASFKTRVMPWDGALAFLSPTLTCMCLFPDKYSPGLYLEMEQGWGPGSGLW